MTPLIIAPADAAMLIGTKCGGASPDAEDPAMIAILQGLTDRIAKAMNVDTLVKGDHIDRFYLNAMPGYAPSRGPTKATIRLNNGFVNYSSLVMTNEDNETVTDPVYLPKAIEVDTLLGLVDLSTWSRGYYTFSYESGLDTVMVGSVLYFTDVPEWMKHAVVLLLVAWYRSVYLTPRTPKDASLAALMGALYRELTTRIYESYQRPRAGVVWCDAR